MVGNKVTYETNGTDTIYYTYDNSDKLVSMDLNGVEYYYIRNAQGDIIGLFDKTGIQVVSYNYDSWGKLISIDGSLKDTVGVKNPYRYRGYRYETETGLYYLQSRYYNPDWGRFINADADGGKIGELLSHNVFAYCMNNPVNLQDENGNFPSFNDIIQGAKNIVNTIEKHVVASIVTTVTVVAAVIGINYIIAHPHTAVAASTAITTIQKTANKVSKVSSKPSGDVDFYATQTGEVLSATKKGLDAALSEMQQVGGKFVGQDSKGPLRVRIEQHLSNPNFTGELDPYHTVQHIHIDRRINITSGRWEKVLTLPIKIFKQ